MTESQRTPLLAGHWKTNLARTVTHALPAAGRGDLACRGGPFLKNPNLVLHAAEHDGYPDIRWPEPWLAVKPRTADASP